MKKKLFTLAILLISFSNITYSNILTKIDFDEFINISKEFVESGIEIRYYVHKDTSDKLPQEVIVNEIKYPLYKSKESAIESIKNVSIKKDYYIVYVISDVEKNTEIISIAD